MKFREWIHIHEAGRVVSRGSAQSQGKPYRHNNDLPLNKAPVAVAHGISSSLMQSLEKSGAEFNYTPSVPSYDYDGMEKGEILDDQGVTSASLPLQMPRIAGRREEVVFNPKMMRTIDNKNGDPSVDGLYVLYNDEDKDHDLTHAIRHTKRLAEEEVLRLLARSGEINKVEPKPAQEKQYLNDGILTMVFQFRPKKGGK